MPSTWEPWEHALVALPEACFVPLGELAPTGRARAGGRHAARDRIITASDSQAAGLLAANGHLDVVSLASGIDAWARVVNPAMTRY